MAETSYWKVLDNIRNWPLSRKLALAATALLSVVLFAVIILQTNRADYQPLYMELPQEEAASVTSWLREQGIAYQLKNSGRSIHVPADLVYETRLNLAGAGLPKQGGVGFEIFDKQNFGVTKFTQRINLQRALQGELVRTISALDAVKSARVHLVLPENHFLEEQRKPAKASVVVDLAAGRTLDMSQTQGIIHLVAGSIEGLEKNQVTIVDTDGRILSQGASTEPGMAMLPETLKFRTTLENRLEDRAQSLLDRALGLGNSIVRVSAEVDFTEEAITSEEYDPDSLVPRSEHVTKSESGYAQSGGVPGVESNLGESPTIEKEYPTSQSSEITNYEVNKTLKHIKNPVGKVKNLSAAVLIAETFKPDENGGPGTYVPVPDEKIESIRRMIATALGIEAARGDRIEVVSMPFKKNMFEMEETAAAPAIYEYLPYFKYLVWLVCAGLLYFLLIRPMIRTLKGASVPYNKTVAELEDQFAQGRLALDSPAKLRMELGNYSVTPAQVIKTWLKEG